MCLLLAGVPKILVDEPDIPNNLRTMIFGADSNDDKRLPGKAKAKDCLDTDSVLAILDTRYDTLDITTHSKFYHLVANAMSRSLDIKDFLKELSSLTMDDLPLTGG